MNGRAAHFIMQTAIAYSATDGGVRENMSYEEEFSTVSLLTNSTAETRAVDAFALALIKAERQIRRLFTHVVYQSPAFAEQDIEHLKESLSKNRRVYFSGMISGFNSIYPKSIEVIIGHRYETLHRELVEAIGYRNKIFHGQLTNNNLSRDELLAIVSSIAEWCQLLATGAKEELRYDGFERNSFRKSENENMHVELRVALKSVDDYEGFIRRYMQNP